MEETSKAVIRRFNDIRFVTQYFRGQGIDIGAGNDPLSRYSQQFPLMTTLKAWDLQDGDAEYMAGVEDHTYDFVVSSHCLEHMRDPYQAFDNWLRITRAGGYLIITVPDEDMYEQGQWPSTYNSDHKTTWTILKTASWSPVSINLLEFLYQYKDQIEVVKIEQMDTAFIRGVERFDQTYQHIAESCIEFIVRKLTDEDRLRKGTYNR